MAQGGFLHMLKWYIGRVGNKVPIAADMQLGEGVFVLIYIVFLVLLGIIVSVSLRM
jgi:hypothetical protein